ncbi:effector-binding domain-containing protein [Asanoa hainanensis]|uniref:Effector-binding domain-containing protein n=1 Tax=Asanoa hainanensis TaxID=560556 RepID=A0A239PEB0_9ACTN|nr:GyrI-like domain-containing protein [Asanoa hainanensis]SNT64739.1 effector-binding domain-containing protein [Asanoa hainanensis]
MTTEPTVTDRPAQDYIAIKRTVTMSSIADIADRIPDLFTFLRQRGIAPVGPPFLKYNVIDMAGDLEIEAGVPVNMPVACSGEIFADVLPAGRYVTVTHVGHPDELLDVTANLLGWAHGRHLEFDHHDSPAGDVWRCRLETYNSNPAEVPVDKWETELAFLLR